MTLTIRPRGDWQLPSQPVTGPKYPTATIQEVVYHYPGSGANTNYSDPVRSLRNMQASYLAARGYSLGYGYAIDPTGGVWEVRGVDIRPAATAGYNDKGVAVQFLVPGVEPANDAQMQSAVELHRWLEEHHGRTLSGAGHYQRGTTATPCPGAGVKPQIPEIVRRAHTPTTPTTSPAPTPTPPVQEDEDMPLTYQDPRDKSLHVIATDLGHRLWVTKADHDALVATGLYKWVDISTDLFDRIPDARTLVPAASS